MKLCAVTGLLAIVLGISACRQADVRTAAIHVPQMKSQACANLILKQLGADQQVHPTQVVVRIETQTLEIRYDSLRHSLKNLEYAIADAGFSANDIPANEAVRRTLPPDCR